MAILILILVVLIIGISIGFMIGFSRVMQRVAERSSQNQNPTVAGKILIVVGCICLVGSVFAFTHNTLFLRSAQRSTGTVTQMRERTSKESGNVMSAPTFEFQDSTGQKHTIDSQLYSFPPRHHVGDTVAVLYLPAKPDDACIDGFMDLWGLTVIMGGVGLLQIPTGLVFLNWPRIKAWWQAKMG